MYVEALWKCNLYFFKAVVLGVLYKSFPFSLFIYPARVYQLPIIMVCLGWCRSDVVLTVMCLYCKPVVSVLVVHIAHWYMYGTCTCLYMCVCVGGGHAVLLCGTVCGVCKREFLLFSKRCPQPPLTHWPGHTDVIYLVQ